MYFTLTFNHVQNSLLMVHFSQILSLSVPITLFFHPKKPPISQIYFLFPSENAIPFLIPSLLKTHILLSLSNQELTFILAFYRLVNINTSDNFFKKVLENISGWHQTLFINSPKSLVSL